MNIKLNKNSKVEYFCIKPIKRVSVFGRREKTSKSELGSGTYLSSYFNLHRLAFNLLRHNSHKPGLLKHIYVIDYGRLLEGPTHFTSLFKSIKAGHY